MKKFNWNLFAALLVFAGLVFTSCEDDDDDKKSTKTIFTVSGKTVTIKDLGEGIGNYTMHSDTTYVLDGFVFVNSGQTLIVKAGTMIQGKGGSAESASALIVARDGKMEAVGTADKPIVLTGEGDTYTGEGSNLTIDDNAKWGGLIILGNAETNNTDDKRIEGIPSTETRGYYGGNNNTDNSGTYKYLSVRHGGTLIGEDNEINGISLGAVGSGTTFDYLEVVANKDDGIEFFGGVPRVKHAVVAYVGDDSFDYDEGFSGYGQFWVALQGTKGERCAEQDGGTKADETSKPYAMPVISNATYIANGGSKFMIFRDNAGGTYNNSIFANAGEGIRIEFRDDKESTSYKQLTEGNLKISGNIFSDIKAEKKLIFAKVEKDDDDKPIGELPADHETKTKAEIEKNTVVSLGLSDTKMIPTGDVSGFDNPGNAWFETVDYKGAFKPGAENWAKGWTLSVK